MKNLDNKKTALFIILAVFLLLVDRFLKILAIGGIFDQPIWILKNWFSLHFSPNPFIAFSLPVSGVILEVVIGLIILSLLYCFVVLLKQRKLSVSVFLFFTIVGAMSNFFDRLRYGFVIDYFDLKYFTVFNLADLMIVGGVLLLFFNQKTFLSKK